MKKIEPYRNIDEAIKSLDNGGRFYSNVIKANDGVINQAELERIGGGVNDKQEMILLFEMSISKLSEADKASLFSKLDSDAMQIYEEFKPQELNTDDAGEKGKLSKNAIITGTPKLVDFDANLNWSVQFPKEIGNITTMVITPLIKEYHVYELEDEESNETFLIAHKHGTEKLSNRRVRLGGVIKELRRTSNGAGSKGKFLETMYHFRS